jgi:cell division protein ZipA
MDDLRLILLGAGLGLLALLYLAWRVHEWVEARLGRAVAAPVEEAASTPAGAPPEKLLVLHVQARGEPLRGSAVRTALEVAGLVYGDMNIWHRLPDAAEGGPRGGTVFAIANMVKPGTLEPDVLAVMTTPGLSLFMRLPGPVAPLPAVADFYATARQLALELHAEVLDEQRQPLSWQAEKEQREAVANWLAAHGLHSG